MRPRSLLFKLSLSLLLVLAAPARPEVALEILARTGARSPQPGLNYDLLLRPAIDRAGNVVFFAGLEAPAPGTRIGQALVRASRLGGVRLVAFADPLDPAQATDPTGMSEHFFELGFTDGPIPDVDGSTYFRARALRPDSMFLGRVAVWRERSGSFTRLVNEDDVADGTIDPDTMIGSRFREFDQIFASGATDPGGAHRAAVSFLGRAGTIDGVWATAGGGVLRIALEDDPAPVGPPGVIFDDLGGAIVQGFGVPVNASGHLAFRGSLGGPGVDFSNDSGFFEGDASGVSLVAREGDPTPIIVGACDGQGAGVAAGIPCAEDEQCGIGGACQAGEVVFTGLGGHSLNGDGDVVFNTLFGGSALAFASNDAIFAQDGGQLFPVVFSRVVTETAEPAPRDRVVFQSSNLPGFLDFSPPVINDADQIVFHARFREDAGAGAVREGIWKWAPLTGLTLVAATGLPAPGTGGSFNDLVAYALSSDGAVVYTGSFAGGEFGEGIWVEDAGGNPVLIVRSGQEIEVELDVVKTVQDVFLATGSGNADGRRSGISDRGHVAFTARFDDGTRAVLRATYEAPCPDGTTTTSDRDGDALFDCWEEQGIDIDRDGDVDLPLHQAPFSANPDCKDIFVEVDYMDCAEGGCAAGDTHTHQPDAGALQGMVDAFAAAPVNGPGCTGVTLHFVGKNGRLDEALPESDPLNFRGRSPGTDDDFNDLKYGNPEDPCGTDASDGHFGTEDDRRSANCEAILEARRQVFHYVIFGHTRPGTTSGGQAELPGNDMVVTLGGWTPAGIASIKGQREAEAATFMHEFGHNFRLRHGGVDDVNCKPNYLSIQSYSLIYKWIDDTRPLDYSRQKLATLDESSLDEAAGIGGPAGRTAVWGVGGGSTSDPADGPLDWNGAGGAAQVGVNADINRITDICNAAGTETLEGFDDWSNLVFDFRSSPDFADGPERVTALEDEELNPDVAEAVAGAADFDKDGISNRDDNCAAVPNAGQEDADGDGVGDSCECGDFDGDGRVNTTDARLIQRCAVDQIPCEGLCDVTGEGDCNTSDARLIQRLAVGQLAKDDLRCAERP